MCTVLELQLEKFVLFLLAPVEMSVCEEASLFSCTAPWNTEKSKRNGLFSRPPQDHVWNSIGSPCGGDLTNIILGLSWQLAFLVFAQIFLFFSQKKLQFGHATQKSKIITENKLRFFFFK